LDTGNTSTITAMFLSLAEKHGRAVIMARRDPNAQEIPKGLQHARWKFCLRFVSELSARSSYLGHRLSM
jgi:hypothetical protein